jgi:hypothetical protein
LHPARVICIVFPFSIWITLCISVVLLLEQTRGCKIS